MVFRPEVFLSATPVELDAYREVARKTLREIGARVVEQCDYTVAYGPLQGVLFQHIQRCELVIHLAGRQYGIEPAERTLGAPKRSFGQYEIDVARSIGKPIFAFLTTPEAPVAALPPEGDEERTLQHEHRSALERSGDFCARFRDADDLAQQIRALRSRIVVRRRLSRLPRAPLGERLVGRKQLLEALFSELGKPGLTVLHPSAEYAGSGGTGCTTLAIEAAAHLHEQGRFPFVFFLPGGPRADLEVALASLARSDALGLLPDEVAGHRARFDAVMEWFRRAENHGRWLIILDGADDAVVWARVRQLLPSLGEGTILVTSRLKTWPGVRALPVPPWGAEQARGFLLSHTMPGKPHSRGDLAAADRLMEGVGRLPLAMQILARDLLERRMTPVELVTQSMSEIRGQGGASARVPHPPTVAEILDRSIAALDPFARALFRQLACLAPQPASIPAALFEPRGDWPQIRAALTTLENRALLEKEDGGRAVSIHRLVREMALDRVPAAELTTALGAALATLDAALRRTQVNTGSLREALIPHCRALLGQLNGHPLELHAATVAQTFARWLQDAGRLSEAEPFFRRALAIDTKRLGKDHPDLAVRLRDLAGVLRLRGRVSEAEPLSRQALALSERASGPEHPEIVGDLYQIAACLRAANHLEEAEEYCRRALRIEEQHSGRTHPRTAVALHRLAGVAEAARRYFEAEALYRRALAIDERASGPHHPRVIAGSYNLAGVLATLGRLADAETLLRPALAFDEKTYGPTHLEIAPALKQLASIVAARGDLAEAEVLLSRVLAIEEGALGPEHTEVAADLLGLADLCFKTGRAAEAEPLIERALRIYLTVGKRLRLEYPQFREALAFQAEVLAALGKPEEEIAAHQAAMIGIARPRREHAAIAA